MGMMGMDLEKGLGRVAMSNNSSIPKPIQPMPLQASGKPMNISKVSPLGSPGMTAVAGTATRALNPMTFMATGTGGMMQMHPEIGKYMRMFRRVPSWKLGTMGDQGW